ncbi:MAG TPA: NAD(P)-dependent oxidoreductase [candidate division Zixibacteria bacterium]|nr:NAD(P)-dependent oxidoreductase [candidate division Zixibacteria bacterium]
MAKILLTGAFGNVGTSTLEELIKMDNHFIRCFDIPTKANKKKAKKFQQYNDKVEIFWGDLRDQFEVEKAVEDIDAIIHLGAIIPPLANNRPEIAEPVNVGGTKNIITAIKKQTDQPKLIFSSSVATYGDVRYKGLDYVIQTTDEFNPSPFDHYARHKIKCEEMIKSSGINWSIFRFSAIPPLDQGLDPLMFEVPLDTPIEYTHTKDTGLALAKAVTNDFIWGKILHIAGGPINRVSYEDFVGRMLDAMGIGRLPKEAFGNEPFHCGYMDTTESQRILQYQNRTFDDYLKFYKKRLAFARILAIIFKPAVRSWLLRKSPHYRAHLKAIKEYMKPKRRIARAKQARIEAQATKKAKQTTSKTHTKDPAKTGN